MARSKNCLRCKYCTRFGGADIDTKDWKNYFCCTYYLDTGKNDDKGSNPDKCKLFTPKNGTNRRNRKWVRGDYV